MTLTPQVLTETILNTGTPLISDSQVKNLIELREKIALRRGQKTTELSSLSKIYKETQAPAETENEMHWLRSIARVLQLHREPDAHIDDILLRIYEASSAMLPVIIDAINNQIQNELNIGSIKATTDFDPRHHFGINAKMVFNCTAQGINVEELEQVVEMLASLEMPNLTIKELAKVIPLQPAEEIVTSVDEHIKKCVEKAEERINTYAISILKPVLAHVLDPAQNPAPETQEQLPTNITALDCTL